MNKFKAPTTGNTDVDRALKQMVDEMNRLTLQSPASPHSPVTVTGNASSSFIIKKITIGYADFSADGATKYLYTIPMNHVLIGWDLTVDTVFTNGTITIPGVMDTYNTDLTQKELFYKRLTKVYAVATELIATCKGTPATGSATLILQIGKIS